MLRTAPFLPNRGLQPAAEAAPGWIVGGDLVGKDRRDDQHHEEDNHREPRQAAQFRNAHAEATLLRLGLFNTLLRGGGNRAGAVFSGHIRVPSYSVGGTMRPSIVRH